MYSTLLQTFLFGFQFLIMKFQLHFPHTKQKLPNGVVLKWTKETQIPSKFNECFGVSSTHRISSLLFNLSRIRNDYTEWKTRKRAILKLGAAGGRNVRGRRWLQKLSVSKYLVFEVSSAGLMDGCTHSYPSLGWKSAAWVSQPSSLCLDRKDHWSWATPLLRVGWNGSLCLSASITNWAGA